MKQKRRQRRQMGCRGAASWWRAIGARDGRSDGRFVFGVWTTGIYCRPSCPARRPRPENVIFFPSPEVAERAGFRACKRCQPRLFEDSLERGRLEEELRAASEIQLRLQPVALPAVEGWEMAGVSSPCRPIGGDYYDIFERTKDKRIIIALGDVAGKGLAAALLMSSLHAVVRAQSRLGAPVSQVMSEINQYIYENTPLDRFLTLFYAELDPVSGAIEYGNAGHQPALVGRASGEIVRLAAGGPPVGILTDVSYATDTVALGSGDTLTLYSDGISESVNAAGEEFGESRLIEVARQGMARSAAGLCDRIGEALARFVGPTPPVDDRALVIVKRTLAKAMPVPEATSSVGDRALACA
jgi:sigma-B regulation protein RsbU (phosphoserine phosphatase)